MASAAEATVNRVLDELSEEALNDPLQVSAAVQQAFTEAAAKIREVFERYRREEQTADVSGGAQ